MSYFVTAQDASNVISSRFSPGTDSCPRLLRSPLLLALAPLQPLSWALWVSVISASRLSHQQLFHSQGVFFIHQGRLRKLMVGKNLQPAHCGPSSYPARMAGANEGVREEVCLSLGETSQSQEMGLFLRHARAAPFSRRQGLAPIKVFLYSPTALKQMRFGSLLSEGFRCFGKCCVNTSQL